jgi:hypothetical protein
MFTKPDIVYESLYISVCFIHQQDPYLGSTFRVDRFGCDDRSPSFLLLHIFLFVFVFTVCRTTIQDSLEQEQLVISNQSIGQ